MLVSGGAWRDWESDRRAVVDHLVSLVAGGRLDLANFEDLATAAFAASSHEELAAIVATTPGPVALTPPHLRRDDPLEIDVGNGQIVLEKRWQLAEQTIVNVKHGQAVIDLTKAEWDSANVDLDLRVVHGQIVVTVPDGVRVSFERLAANVVNRLRDDVLLPGAPELHIYTDVGHGQIVLRSPKQLSRFKTWRLRRRARRVR